MLAKWFRYYGGLRRPQGPLIKFLAAAPDSVGVMQQQVKGLGTETCTHASSIYAPDWEGVYRKFLTNEPVWEGGRTARNLFATPLAPVTQVVALTGGHTYLLQAWGTFDIDVTGSVTSSLTGTDTRKVVKLSPASDGNATFTLNTAPDKFMLEDSTGQTDVDTPSEFSVTVATYCYENGNSVAAGVVTEGTLNTVSIYGRPVTIRGTILSPLPSLAYNPDATNDQIQSNDQTNAEWTSTNITPLQDEVGITGDPNTACTLTATAANGTCIANAITAASATHATAWHIKRKTGTGTIELTVDNGATWQDITSSVGSSFSRIAVDQAAVTNPQIGIRIVTDTDAVIVGNDECHLTKTLAEVRGAPPIFTTTGPVSINETEYTFDQINHDNTQGAYYFEFIPSVSRSENDVLNQQYINSYITYIHISGWISTYDGTTASQHSKDYIANESLKVAVVFSANDSIKNINVNGVWMSDSAYDGSYDGNTYSILRWLDGLKSAAVSRSIHRWQGGAYAQLKAEIDSLMA